MNNTGNPRATGMDFTFARRCHICGGGPGRKLILRWCPICLETYGEKRRPVSKMTDEERQWEIHLLLSPPYEIPFAFIIRRVIELKNETMGFSDICKLEGEMEVKQDRPMFVWPPPSTMNESEVVVETEEVIELTGGHRQPVDTLRGVPHAVEERVSSEFDLRQPTLPHGQYSRIKTPPPKK